MAVAARLRRFILSAFQPVAKRIGHIYIAFRRPKMNLGDLSTIITLIKPGDVLVCRSSGEFTNYFIPGFFTHAALYVSNGEIVEAVSPTVRIHSLGDFVLSKDFIAVLRPLFATDLQKHAAVMYARLQASAHVPYDYQFNPNEKEFYCAELIGQSYVVALDNVSPFTPRYTLGVLTYVPDDFYNALDKFELIYVKKDKKVPPRKGLRKG